MVGMQCYFYYEGNAESVMTGRCGVFICKVSSCEELSLLVMVVVLRYVEVSLSSVLLVTLCSAADETTVSDATIVISKMNLKIMLKVKGFYLFQTQHLPQQRNCYEQCCHLCLGIGRCGHHRHGHDHVISF